MICDLSDRQGGGWGPISQDNILSIRSWDAWYFRRDCLPESSRATTIVKVSYHYGFSMDMGGGEYQRTQSFDSFPNSKNIEAVPSPYATIEDALNALNGSGVVEIGESEASSHKN